MSPDRRFATFPNVAARTLVGHNVGAAYDPPEYLEVPDRLRRLHDPVFASAVAAYLAALSRRRGERGDDRTRLIRGRLRAITSLVMVRDLRVEYRIAGRPVLVDSAFAVERERALFAGVRKKAELTDLLSRAVAEIVAGNPKDALEIADPIYRLLACTDAEEMEQNLARGGVPWSAEAANSRSRRLDEEEEHAPASAPIQQVLGDVLTRNLGGTSRPAPAPAAPAARQAPTSLSINRTPLGEGEPVRLALGTPPALSDGDAGGFRSGARAFGDEVVFWTGDYHLVRYGPDGAPRGVLPRPPVEPELPSDLDAEPLNETIRAYLGVSVGARQTREYRAVTKAPLERNRPLRGDGSGHLWALTTRDHVRRSHFDVFDRDGFIGSASVPDRVLGYDIRGDLLAALVLVPSGEPGGMHGFRVRWYRIAAAD